MLPDRLILMGENLVDNVKIEKPKYDIFGDFQTLWVQTMFLDRSISIGQKLVENAKIEKFKCDIWSNFQTICNREQLIFAHFDCSKLLLCAKIQIWWMLG